MKFKKGNNLYIQLIIIILAVIYYFYNNSNKVMELKTGDDIVTKESKSRWYILKSKQYNNNTLSELFKIRYGFIFSYIEDDYPIFKGHITLLDEKENLIGIFNRFSIQLNQYDFIYYFGKYVDMNNEIYKMDIKDGLLYLKFLNNFSNNTVIQEKEYENGTFSEIKEIYYNSINKFLEYYFDEEIELPVFYENKKYSMVYILSITLIFTNIFIYVILFIINFLKYKKHSNEEYIPLK